MLKDYKIHNEESIIDATINVYGELSNVVGLMINNNIDVLTDDYFGRQIQYNSALVNNGKIEYIVSIKNKVRPEFETITGVYGQSIYDLTLLAYGSLDNVIELLISNNISSIDKDNGNGIDITYQTKFASYSNSTGYFYGYKNIGTLDEAKRAGTGKSFNRDSFDISFH